MEVSTVTGTQIAFHAMTVELGKASSMFPVTMLRNVQPAVIRRPRMTSACMRALKLNEHLRRHSTDKVVPQEKALSGRSKLPSGAK